jgi:hypothetical protein
LLVTIRDWKKELPMEILARVGTAVQRLFGDLAEAAAARSGVIQRRRKFTARTLARTFVLGCLRHPDASAEELAQLAAQTGVAVTAQAIDQRHTPKLVACLRDLFASATRLAVGSNRALAPLLERFAKVIVLDSSVIALPDSQATEFPGCGGGRGGGVAAMKLQTEFDLRSGAVTAVEVEPGRCPDGASSRQHARHGVGSLRITDLGYFNVAVFAALVAAKEHFLSRWQFGTHVLGRNGTPLALLSWLGQQRGPFVDQPVLLGQAERLACRLLAWQLPPEQVNRRRQKLRQEYRSKYGHEPSVDRLAWCAWTVLVTSVPVEQLSPPEAAVLYRARWQVELLFKRWKTQDRVALLRGSTEVRQLVRVWSRLLAALVQHWLVITSVAGDPTKSLSKACEAVREFAGRLAASLDCPADVMRVLADLGAALAKTCRRNRRSKPGTFALLNDVSLLDFCLT